MMAGIYFDSLFIDFIANFFEIIFVLPFSGRYYFTISKPKKVTESDPRAMGSRSHPKTIIERA